MHGWPGSFLEFEGLIGPLTDPVSHGGEQEDAFDVVIVSHPGFGFSTPLVGADWKRADIARAYLELMSRLGYERFAVQGGDVGAGVAPEIARLAPERVIGVHVNGSLGTFVGQLDEETAARLTPLEQDRLRRVALAVGDAGQIPQLGHRDPMPGGDIVTQHRRHLVIGGQSGRGPTLH